MAEQAKVREVDSLWQATYRALLNKIARRDADYLELHADFIEQQKLLADYRRQFGSLVHRQAIEDANRIANEWRV